MVKLLIDNELKPRLKEAYRRLDEDMKEFEELHEEMDKMLYDIERRISKLRRPREA